MYGRQTKIIKTRNISIYQAKQMYTMSVNKARNWKDIDRMERGKATSSCDWYDWHG